MTLAAGTGSDDETPKMSGETSDETPGKPSEAEAAGTSLAPATSGAAGIDPFLASAGETADVVAARPLYARLLDYSAHAAMIVGLIGFAWTVSDHVVTRPTAAQIEAPTKLADAGKTAAPKPVEAPKVDEIGDLRRANQKMAAELRGLHASLEALRVTVGRDRSSDDARALSAGLDSVKSGLAATKSETSTALAQLSGKIDKLQREARPQQVSERAARPERQAVDTTETASIPPAASAAVKAVPTPPAKPTTLASVEEEPAKPQVLTGWVVRDVYDGVALIEGKRGPMEVVPGVSVPGAGVVKSIERHGSGWTVTTSKGQLAYAAQARGDYRRGGYGRDYYSNRRYDY